MNHILITACIFLFVLVLYIYIMNQFKRSEDLEIYEMDYTTNVHLQEVCDARQPFLFYFREICPSLIDAVSQMSLAKHGSKEVQIKDMADYYDNHDDHAKLNIISGTPLSLENAAKLLETSTSSPRYFSENNGNFLQESGLLSKIEPADTFLKPTCNIYTKYDVLLGQSGVSTPLQYHTHYRKFVAITSGSIRVKMAPWKHTTHLHPIHDYENYEFRSPVHPTKPNDKHKHDVEKVEWLEFTVDPGYILYIPPYWWYSLQFSEDPSTMALSISYVTFMNIVANSPSYALHWLQLQNITKLYKKTPANLTSELVVNNKELVVNNKTEDMDHLDTSHE